MSQSFSFTVERFWFHAVRESLDFGLIYSADFLCLGQHLRTQLRGKEKECPLTDERKGKSVELLCTGCCRGTPFKL